ncbi:MAG: hypothetical protein IMZ44_07485 [Planctomycetes bacterium]|nr:hypothetical protein [Planctomycetota bacterium]
MNFHKASPWIFWERDLLKSRAWLDLGGVAPQVYGLFRLRVQVRQAKRDRRQKRTTFEMANNGQIVFPYMEAQRGFGITSPRFRRALEELVENGFLDITHHGGGLEGDTTKYAISDRWRSYGKPDFKAATLPKGRPWTTRETRPTNGNVRAPANASVRGQEPSANGNVRASAPKRYPDRERKRARSIESTSQCVPSVRAETEAEQGLERGKSFPSVPCAGAGGQGAAKMPGTSPLPPLLERDTVEPELRQAVHVRCPTDLTSIGRMKQYRVDLLCLSNMLDDAFAAGKDAVKALLDKAHNLERSTVRNRMAALTAWFKKQPWCRQIDGGGTHVSRAVAGVIRRASVGTPAQAAPDAMGLPAEPRKLQGAQRA